LIGVALVLEERISLNVGFWAVALSVIALFGISVGTVYQKRFCPTLDLRSGIAVQYFATAIYVGIFALTLETRHVEWTGRFVFALVWLMLVLSIGAVSLLFILLRRGSASRTAALFYLVPPCTALVAWLLFDERLGWIALLGMAIAAAGVFLATRPTKDPAPVAPVETA
jgi:drug/metabolite transporter (DMT)-like permease